jgi:hypothetical protein
MCIAIWAPPHALLLGKLLKVQGLEWLQWSRTHTTGKYRYFLLIWHFEHPAQNPEYVITHVTAPVATGRTLRASSPSCMAISNGHMVF